MGMKKPHFVSKMRFFKAFSGFYGGDKRDRTADLLNAMGSIVNINEYFWSKQSNMSNYIA